MAGTTYAVDGSGSKYVATAAALVREVLAVHAGDVDATGRFPQEALDALARSGLLGLFAPGQLGGGGQGPRVFAAVVEELALGCASAALIYVMHVAGAQAIAASSALDSRDAILREIAAGRHLTTLALSEGRGGQPPWAPSSALEPRDGGYVVSARKALVAATRHADSFVASARCPGASSAVDTALFLMRPRAGEVRPRALAVGLGLRGAEAAPVDIEGYRLGAADLVAALGDGLRMSLEVVLPWQSVGLAALANGIALASVEATAAYLVGAGADGQREGSELRDFAGPRARLAEMSVRTEQARALLGQAVAVLEMDAPSSTVVSMQSRLAALAAARDVTELAVTVG